MLSPVVGVPIETATAVALQIIKIYYSQEVSSAAFPFKRKEILYCFCFPL